jgi:hypothetical protein
VAFGEIGLVRETLIYADFVFQIYSLEIHFQDYFFTSHFLLFREARSIKENEQRLVGSQSG